MSKPLPSRKSADRAPGREDAKRQKPERGWLRSLLTRRVRLERRGLNVHVLLEAPALPDTTAPDSSAGEALRRAHAQLGALLDRHPDTRHLMRHLGYLERTLRQSGSRAFRQVPSPVLQRALEQLTLLLRGESADGIEPLRLRLERALRERPADAAAGGREPALDVSEASHSLFDEMERSWTGKMPFEKTVPQESRL